jgi:hypothetical protein
MQKAPLKGESRSSAVAANATVVDLYPELNAFLDNMRDVGVAKTNEWKEMWFSAIQYAWGQQLQGWDLKEDWQYVIVNRVYPLMFQSISKLAGNNPKIFTQAWDDDAEGSTEYATKWANHLQYLWESPYELNMRLKMILGLLDCCVFGYMVGSPRWEEKPRGGWDDKNKKWVGKSEIEIIHPALFWCDPSAESIATAQSCGTTRRVKLEWAVNRWPEHKAAIEKEAYDCKDAKYTAGDLITYQNQKGSTVSASRQNMFSRLASIILGSSENSGDSANSNGENSQKYVDIDQVYWCDYEEKHITIKDNISKEDLLQRGKIVQEEITGIFIDTETKAPLAEWPTQIINEYDEPVYPNGRFVLRIGRTILNPKEEDQTYKESLWPFIVMPYHILPHMWQGGNAVEMVRNSQDFLNITVSSLVNQVRRTADPTKIIEAGALAKGRDGKTRTKKDDITGLGRIIVAAKGKIAAMSNMIYPPVDPAVYSLSQILRQDIDDQMFMQAIARGESNKGQQTRAEVLTLNQNSLEYAGLQGIFLDKWIDDAMTLIAEICQRNYEPDRLMKMLADGTRAGTQITQPMLDVRFDVNIEPGSTLPFDEIKKQTEYSAAYKLFESPVPNPLLEDMLRILNISKRKEILSKYQGLQLYKQFIGVSAQSMAMLSQVNPQIVQTVLAQIPQLQPVLQLMQQAAGLAPKTGVK